MFGKMAKRPVDQLIKDSFAKEKAPDLFDEKQPVAEEKPVVEEKEPKQFDISKTDFEIHQEIKGLDSIGLSKWLVANAGNKAAKYIAELKVLRALYYYWLLDWFGNVPLSIDFKNVDPPKNATQAQVYAFIESELTTNGALLAKPASVPDVASYGRVNYYAAQAILAKLYLNAKTYTGTEQNAKALAAANTIINAGVYKLSPTYAENFIQNNAGAKETILGVPFDRIKLGGFNLQYQCATMEWFCIYF